MAAAGSPQERTRKARDKDNDPARSVCGVVLFHPLGKEISRLDCPRPPRTKASVHGPDLELSEVSNSGAMVAPRVFTYTEL